jgi:hypothetical protein
MGLGWCPRRGAALLRRCSAEPGPIWLHGIETPDQQRITPKSGVLRSIRGT